MNLSQTKSSRYAGMGFAVAAIAFALTESWLLALAFALLAISFIANSAKARSDK